MRALGIALALTLALCAPALPARAQDEAAPARPQPSAYLVTFEARVVPSEPSSSTGNGKQTRRNFR